MMMGSKQTQRQYFNICCKCCVRRSLSHSEAIIDDDVFVTTPTKIGANILCYGKKKSRWPMHCHIGPDWIGVIVVYTSIIVVNIIVLAIISPIGCPVTLIGGIYALCLLYSYSVVAFSDPGVIYKEYRISDTSDLEIQTNNQNIIHNNPLSIPTINHDETVRQIECGTCEMNRPITASHCSYCDVCIDKLDHHCPWCGKCIGKKTITMFHTFLCLLQFQCYFLCGSFIYFMLAIYTIKTLPIGP